MGLDNPLHIAFLVVILLLVFGARRLPEIGRSLGSGMREFKDSITGDTNRQQQAALPQGQQAPVVPPQSAPAPPPQQAAPPPQAAPPAPEAAPPQQAPPAQVPAEPTHQG
jgi:sec-independent protein translocase protein TatA